jgi:hypothetical protein
VLQYFGKDFVYNFYPLTTDNVDYELLPDDPIAIYVFDGYPSADDAANGTTNDGNYSILETILAWEDTDDSYGKQFEVSAIPVPIDLGNNLSKKYYLAINTELTPGEPLPAIIKEVTLELLRAQESAITVNVTDLLGLEPTLKNICNCVGDLQKYIDAAIRQVKLMTNGCDFDFSAIVDPAQLNYSVIQLAISKAYYGQSRSPADIFAANGLRFHEDFKSSMKLVNLQLDKNQDGRPEGIRKSKTGMVTLRMVR